MSHIELLSRLGTLPFFFVLAGSFLPALLWLWFWLREDRERPEPPIMLVLAFFGGMASVFTALILQNFLYKHNIGMGPLSITLYVATEELSKFLFAYIIALRSRSDDEPVDPIIYMIAVALGFSALENAFFITSTFLGTGGLSSFTTGILRYFGATILHTLSSGTIGVFLGLSFYKERKKKLFYLSVGTILAITLHALFNLLIIEYGGTNLLFVFIPFWIGALFLIFFFERIKKIVPTPTFIYRTYAIEGSSKRE